MDRNSALVRMPDIHDISLEQLPRQTPIYIGVILDSAESALFAMGEEGTVLVPLRNPPRRIVIVAIRRIGYAKVGLSPVQTLPNRLWIGSISTNQPVTTQDPDITGDGN